MNESMKNTEVSDPVGTGSSAFESAVTAAVDDSLTTKIGKYRWVICALLFFATTIIGYAKIILRSLLK